jgi:hypothetical protein
VATGNHLLSRKRALAVEALPDQAKHRHLAFGPFDTHSASLGESQIFNIVV